YSGAAVARYQALAHATGRLIAILYWLDTWSPDKLERQIDFMIRNGYSFSYHSYHEIAEDGRALNVHVSGKSRVNRFDMFACCWPGCLSVMYDREKIGLIQIADIKKNNDTALWLKVIRKSDCYFLDRDMAAYRRRKGSITPPTVLQKIRAHYPLFRHAEGMNPVAASIWTMINVFGNTYKKIFYTRKLSD
ncbi:MAG: glycosyltransferase family 2 protein, partial [Muribaculaceae bacterium]|nr:glycosyltransferase family 2 protein [Muribaculaceae bacterium]